jgi:transmembrane sensor
MTEFENDLKRIAARLSGNLSAQEDREFNVWLNSSPKNVEFFEESKKIWEASQSKSTLTKEQLSTDQEWLRLKDRMKQPTQTQKPITFPYTWLALAAGLLFFFFVGKNFFPKNQTPPQLTFIKASDKVLTLYLPDSSRVWLNVNSEISYSKEFTSLRKVILKGEAYFKIKRDPVHPLSVNVNNSEIVVLGTTFNVHEKGNQLSVVVVEGKVDLKEIKSQKSVILTAGEKGEVVAEKVSKTPNKNLLFDFWRRKNNSLYLEEVNNPGNYLAENHTSSKNQINQTVLEGTLSNKASLASYHNIVLLVSYKKLNGKVATTQLKLVDTVRPGQTITYRKKLLDILMKKSDVTVKMVKTDVVK